MSFIIEKRKLFFSISGILVIASIFAVLFWGLPLGIDFTGGSLVEVSYPDGRPSIEEIHASLDKLPFSNEIIVQSTGENGVIVKSKPLSESEHNELISALSFNGKKQITEERFTSIGPSLGKELKKKAIIAIILAIIVIILFVAIAFRHVSEPVASWKYGIIAIIALAHDLIIPTGLFVVLGKYLDAQVDILFVSALLAILGLSVNDTIVVFDRIRENLLKKISKDFTETVDISLKETITRSINTSLTTILVLFSLFLFGPDSTKYFALVLASGLIVGTYSSIFIASPLLIEIAKRSKKT